MASIVACLFLKADYNSQGLGMRLKNQETERKRQKGSKAQGAQSAKVRSKAGTGAGAGASRKGRLNYNANKARCDKRIEYISLSWNFLLLLLLVVSGRAPARSRQPPAAIALGYAAGAGRSPISRPAPTWPHGARQRTTNETLYDATTRIGHPRRQCTIRTAQCTIIYMRGARAFLSIYCSFVRAFMVHT